MISGREVFRRGAIALWMGLLFAPAGDAAERLLTVFAASSLTEALQEIGTAFTADSGIPVRFSFAASSTLARQIESGAPADVFVSADQAWMDYLEQRRLIDPGSRVDVVSNSLVLIAPVQSPLKLAIAPGFALAAALGSEGRLAIGDPAAVPAGRYARAALVKLGVWKSIERRIVAADNVRTALNFVARGEAPLGIVYATDARIEARVRVVDIFPAGSHEPITYPAAVTGSGGKDAAAFLAYLAGADARARFERAGFSAP